MNSLAYLFNHTEGKIDCLPTTYFNRKNFNSTLTLSNKRKASEISEDRFAAIFIVLRRVSFGISKMVKIKQ